MKGKVRPDRLKSRSGHNFFKEGLPQQHICRPILLDGVQTDLAHGKLQRKVSPKLCLINSFMADQMEKLVCPSNQVTLHYRSKKQEEQPLYAVLLV